ncbi:MAG: hypothetical protein K1X94_20905 [Sandaracinaceae bacterium]|jgi:hypothetical protein|nr:hypothetical protein [Sandaracinaceae bacterium]
MRLPSIALSTVLTISAGTALLAPSTGCMMMQGLQPETRLQDHVVLLNDEARWGRVDLAAGRCARAYREAFVRSHRRWGRTIAIGDVEITNIAMQQGGAQSLVTYSWIDQSTQELHATTVRQSWVGEGDGFSLAGEDIIGGDEGLYLDVPGGPHRIEDGDGDVLGPDDDHEIASTEELDREIHGSGVSDESSGSEREQTPGERALASARPRRIDSQGRQVE